MAPLLHGMAGTVTWKSCLDQPAPWYGSKDAIRVAENVLLYQLSTGGWPKNIDMATVLSERAKRSLRESKGNPGSTIDNGATYTQMRFLARVYAHTNAVRFADSFMGGLDYLLRAQLPNGGWPQFYPLVRGYYSHITFNDDAMTGVLNLLLDISRRAPDFEFVDEVRRQRSASAVQKGVACILKCQIKVDGNLTVWCAQHDERDFSPAKARSYELPSLSGAESVGIVEFLMRFDTPDLGIVNSVQSAVHWFDRVQLKGIKVSRVVDSLSPRGVNRVVGKDPDAPPVWARFYEIGSNRPFFCSRDGIKRYCLSEISSERRNHYNWLGYWPERLLRDEYPRWQKKWSPGDNVLEHRKGEAG